AGRERPEALAVLDLEVHHRLHLRTARVADDRAAAERPRPELHPPLAEADDVLAGDHLGDPAGPILVRHLLVGIAVGVEVLPRLLARELGAEQRPLHGVARLAGLRRALDGPRLAPG